MIVCGVAKQERMSREKRSAILRAMRSFQDSTTEVATREEWRSIAAEMGVEKMGGVAPTPAANR